MKRGKVRTALLIVFCAVTTASLAVGTTFAQTKDNGKFGSTIAGEVRHQLVTIPYLSVFDNLEYSVNGSVVTLTGQVRLDAVKRDAENGVKSIPGVTHVVSNIEVLPASPMDDQIRRAVYRAIYGYGPLQRYAEGVLQPIRIVVKQGHVTLEGVVANEADRNLAYMRANGVPNVFSVTNHLQLERPS